MLILNKNIFVSTSVCPCVRGCVSFFFINASPSKLLDIATSNFEVPRSHSVKGNGGKLFDTLIKFLKGFCEKVKF